MISEQEAKVIQHLLALPTEKQYNLYDAPYTAHEIVQEIKKGTKTGKAFVKSIVDAEFKKYVEEILLPSKKATEEYQRIGR